MATETTETIATTIRINLIIIGVGVDDGRGVGIGIEGKGIEVPLEQSKPDISTSMLPLTPILKILLRLI